MPRYGGTSAELLRSIFEDFKRGDIDPKSCFLWPRGLSYGYGRLRFRGRRALAHRLILAWKLGHDSDLDLAADVQTRHSVNCVSRACVNPHHLQPGSSQENILDNIERDGRHNTAKLDADQVNAIRCRLVVGETQAAIAADYGVSQITISRISTGEAWAYVPTTVQPVAPTEAT